MITRINRKQANRLALLAGQHGIVQVHDQLDDASLAVGYGNEVLRALIGTDGKVEVTDTRRAVSPVKAVPNQP